MVRGLALGLGLGLKLRLGLGLVLMVWLRSRWVRMAVLLLLVVLVLVENSLVLLIFGHATLDNIRRCYTSGANQRGLELLQEWKYLQYVADIERQGSGPCNQCR